VPAFDGRGSEQDVAVAVGAGVARAPRFVDLREDFDAREYEVELFNWSPHRSGTVHDLADLADPVSVDRVDPVHLFSEEIAVGVTAAATESGIETVAETQPLGVTAGATTAETIGIGLSSDDLEGLGTTRKLAIRSVSLAATGELATVETADINSVGVQFESSFVVELELLIQGEETSFVSDSFETNRLDIGRRVGLISVGGFRMRSG